MLYLQGLSPFGTSAEGSSSGGLFHSGWLELRHSPSSVCPLGLTSLVISCTALCRFTLLTYSLVLRLRHPASSLSRLLEFFFSTGPPFQKSALQPPPCPRLGKPRQLGRPYPPAALQAEGPASEGLIPFVSFPLEAMVLHYLFPSL